MEFKKYHYTGPQYYYGNKIASKSDIYTMAKSFAQAKNNILFNIANGDIPSRYDIVDDYLMEVPKKVPEPISTNTIQYCPICNGILSDSGRCDCGYRLSDDEL